MRSWLLNVQCWLMRIIGIRKLRQSLNLKADVVHSDLVSRLESLRAQVSQQEAVRGGRDDTLQNSLHDIRVALGELADQLSRQGQADTERGDAIQNTLRDSQAAIGAVRRFLDQGDWRKLEEAIGETRVEISHLRADLAREIELASTHRNGTGLFAAGKY